MATTSHGVKRPVPESEASKPAVVKMWKDLKWKVQPESYNVRKVLLTAMERAVDISESNVAQQHDLVEAQGWLSDLFDEETIEKLFASGHMGKRSPGQFEGSLSLLTPGNFVIIRATGIKDFEDMPIYARVGMHLLFYGPVQIRLLRWNIVREILKAQSIRQGKIYDQEGPDVVERIKSFIKTYEIDMKEVLLQNPSDYKTFNSFFSRKLKPTARPIASPNDHSIIVSVADCRLAVFRNFAVARQFWVKGKKFRLPELLGSADLAKRFGDSPSLAIFRLAPQDYHRFHSPVTGIVKDITTLPGDYYTVNPQAVNQPLDVFTANRRDVLMMEATLSNTTTTSSVPVAKSPVAIVAIGALLVGSVNWDHKVGEEVQKGSGLGYFQYGGSTVIVVFPTDAKIQWDDDLVKASEGQWTGTEDPKIMAKIPAGAQIGPMNTSELFGLEVVVRAAEKIGIATPVVTAVPATSTK